LGLIAAGKGKHAKDVIQIAQDTKEPLPVRLAAVSALGDLKLGGVAHTECANIIQNKKEPLALRLEAIKSLASAWTWRTVPFLSGLFDAKEYPLELRQAAAAAIAAHKAGAESLLESYSAKKLDADLTHDLARLLRNSPFPEVKKLAQKVLPAPPKLDPKKLPSIAALLTRKGNVDRGHNVWLATLKNEAACMKCHTIAGQGGQVGPDLTSIGSKASRENLLESILYPSRAIADQFVQWVVATDGGLVVNGLIIEETPQYILMRDANVKDYKIGSKNIEKKAKLPTSIMPDNLINFLPEDDLLDLVEYLYSLKGAGAVPVLGRKE